MEPMDKSTHNLTDKPNWEADIQQMVSQVNEGWVDAHRVWLALRGLAETAKAAADSLIDQTIAEVHEHGGSLQIGDKLLTIRSSAGRWKYTDEDYLELAKSLKEAEEIRKSAYALGQKGQIAFDESTGLQLPVAEYTPGKETVFLSNAKPKKWTA